MTRYWCPKCGGRTIAGVVPSNLTVDQNNDQGDSVCVVKSFRHRKRLENLPFIARYGIHPNDKPEIPEKICILAHHKIDVDER